MTIVRRRRIETYLLKVISKEKKNFITKPLLFLLLILSFFYGFLYQLRSFLYQVKLLPAKKISTKVICVGNLTTGGTGKTPIVKKLALDLLSKGRRIVIISSGYGSKGADPLIISKGDKTQLAVEQAGDESYLLARDLKKIPIIKGRNRYQAAELAQKIFAPDIILLDDGFQHLQLKRDLDIVVIDALHPFGWDHLLPRGLLREPKEALQRAGAIIISRATHLPKKELLQLQKTIKEYNKKAPLFTAEHYPAYLRPLFSQQGEDLLSFSSIKGKRVITFSGIGNPSAFIRTVKELGATIVDSFFFPGHHYYKQGELRNLQEEAEIKKADYLITTEKDAVKLDTRSFFPPGIEPLVLGIDISIENSKDLLDLIITRQEEENRGNYSYRSS